MVFISLRTCDFFCCFCCLLFSSFKYTVESIASLYGEDDLFLNIDMIFYRNGFWREGGLLPFTAYLDV